jgi:DNA-directed RNA polymerase II subunit RPB1
MMRNLINLCGVKGIRRVFLMKQHWFIIWIEDNSKKPVICCRVLGGINKNDDGIGMIEEDIFLRQLENSMRNSINSHGVKGSRHIFLMKYDNTINQKDGSIVSGRDDCKEWVLEMDGTYLKQVMYLDGVDFTCTYSNN